MTTLATGSNGGAITRPQTESRYENFDEDDFKLPMVHLYHGTPREEERFGSGKFQRGDLINTVSGEKMPSRSFVPSKGWKEWIQFDPNDNSSIIWRTKDRAEAIQRVASQIGKPIDKVNPRDDLYDQTFYNYIVFFDGESMPMLVSFSRTGADAALTLNMLEASRGKSGKGPGYYSLDTRPGISKGIDRMTGEIDPKKRGQKYLRPAIRPLGDPPKELLDLALAYFEQSSDAEISAALVMQETGSVPPAGDGPDFDPSAEQ